jgi:hypothetical protein
VEESAHKYDISFKKEYDMAGLNDAKLKGNSSRTADLIISHVITAILLESCPTKISVCVYVCVCVCVCMYVGVCVCVCVCVGRGADREVMLTFHFHLQLKLMMREMLPSLGS